ncbi:KIF13B [Symbiodinium microadriaticum]|nr:KIF13B [Symbiodinium microadriaticum]CAE7939819.1 KIF13B [Symbiodinium sp. KB8]
MVCFSIVLNFVDACIASSPSRLTRPRSPHSLNRGTSCPPQGSLARRIGSPADASPFQSASARPDVRSTAWQARGEGGESTPKAQEIRSPVPKRRCMEGSKAASASPRNMRLGRGSGGGSAGGALQPRNELPKYVAVAGKRVPVPLLLRIAGLLPVASLPALRRTSAGFYRAIHARLSEDPAQVTALAAHLETKRLKSKRVWVLVRARPISDGISCIVIDRNKVNVSNTNGAPTSFFFDQAFDAAATQEQVCDYVSEQVLPHAINGEHICILAYGQTGSGKTYTMFGDFAPGPSPRDSASANQNQGVAFRAMSRLAEMMRSKGLDASNAPTVELSFLEVYNDNLYDLLDGSRQLPRLRSSEKHVVPQGLTRRRCELNEMEQQVHSWLREGAATRMVGKTVFNPRSSRSHAVVMLHLCWSQQTSSSRLRHLPGSTTRETRVYLVDLAGSERAGLHALGPEQLKEGEHINLSLSALGRVVGALASGKCEHVPYRDSALTWLLKDAITGSSARVCMVAAVHPSHPVETASTLRYARQYSALQNTTGSHASQLSSQVRDLQRRVDSLRHAFEKALAGDEHSIAWTRESLQGSVHCQPKANARQWFESHPTLSWTTAHQSKAAVRGQRRDRSGIGYITKIEEVVGGDEALARVCEVTFEGRHGRLPVVLWYPEVALEMVKPPSSLLEAMQKLDTAEAELNRLRGELQAARKDEAMRQQEWMATAQGKLPRPPPMRDTCAAEERKRILQGWAPRIGPSHASRASQSVYCSKAWIDSPTRTVSSSRLCKALRCCTHVQATAHCCIISEQEVLDGLDRENEPV